MGFEDDSDLEKHEFEEHESRDGLDHVATDESSASTSDPVSSTLKSAGKEVLHDIAISLPPVADDGKSQRGRRPSSQHSHSDSLHSQRTASDHSEGHDHQVPTPRSRSRRRPHSTARSVQRELEIVPRSQRRGLLARFSLIDEVTDPFAYSRRMKWTLTFVVAVAGAAAPMGSAIVLPALQTIRVDLHTTATIVNLNVSMWMIAMSVFPLWWSSFSETLGRRSIYLISFALYLVFNILSAISTSIGMLLAMRVLAGGAAASVQAVGAGSIADFWEVKERGAAMSTFYLGPLCGPLIAPILGGVMNETLGWRSTCWFLAGFGGVVFVLVLFCLPETLRQRKSVLAAAAEEAVLEVKTDEKTKAEPTQESIRPALTRTTTTQSVHIRTKKYLGALRRCFIDPLRIILYLQFPAVAILVAYGSITFASLYVLNLSVQATFSASPYNYSSIIIGLLYIPNSFGYFLSSIFGGKWVDRIMHREARNAGRYDANGKLIFRPEDRLKENAWLAAMLYPSALILYGWTAQYGVNVAVPLVANFFFGVGSMIIFAVATTMLTEFMPRKASNGVALNNFARNILTCACTIATEPVIKAIGNGWLFTIVGVFALVGGALTISVIKKFGDRWRVKMDKNMAKVMGE